MQAEKGQFFRRVGLVQALLETLLIGGVLLAGWLPVGSRLSLNLYGRGLFFLSLGCILWFALRLRFALPSARKGLAFETGAILSLNLLLILETWLFAIVLNNNQPARSSRDDSSGVVWLVVFNCLAYLLARLGGRLWGRWNVLRRRKLVWGLTHAHLMVVLLGALPLIVLAVLQRSFSEVVGQAVPEQGNLLNEVAVRVVLGALPGLTELGILTGLGLTILLPFSAVVSYWLARRTTRRLETLAQATGSLRAGDYSARVLVEGEDEVARLQGDFNTMATELGQARTALQAERDRVAQLLQARRELIASVSHELRTPVATLRGYLDSNLRNWQPGGGPPASLNRDLIIMEGETRRLQTLIEDLFVLARTEVKQLSLQIKPTDLGGLVQRLAHSQASLAWQTGRVQILAQVPPDLPLVRLDGERMEQVLANLLHNALRYTPPGGLVALVVTAEPEAVRIEVRDTGVGIPSEELPHIWERFYQARNQSPAEQRGAGLGLALVKELVEAMGGTVGVESQAGQGSCFMICLPIVPIDTAI